ncbi:hypothetical protein [Spirosoma pulveris]
MKLSWTFYPKGEAAITLTVVYKPELDGMAVGGGGILDVDQNTAYVDWATYKRFDDSSVESRKDAYNRLTRLDGPSEAANLIRLLM